MNVLKNIEIWKLIGYMSLRSIFGNFLLQVREFKGQTYIDIREYYTDKKTMVIMPGKKGISLNCEQVGHFCVLAQELFNENRYFVLVGLLA